MTQLDFAGAAIKLGAGDIDAEAVALGCKPAAIRMTVATETSGSGFLPDNRPQILFEAHVFHQKTNGIYDRKYPNLSSPAWNPALYGAGGDHQYTRLEFAIALNRDAALQSASWGLGQIMGENFKMVGYADVESFVTAMMASEKNQLDAMMAFLKSANLVRYLKTDPPDFTALARGYNGSGQVEHYAATLRANYEKWVARPDVAAPAAAISRTTSPTAFHAVAAPVKVAAKPIVKPAVKRASYEDSDAKAEELNREQPSGG